MSAPPITELTASPDEQAAIIAAGFKRMGEVESTRPDGATRRSLYWELTRAQWERMHRL